jgi:CheY-like chemotaxis protein
VASGQEAVAAVRQAHASAPYRIVFMDWSMPGMSGIEAASEIRKHVPAGLAVIMVTAFGREEVRHEADTAQLDGFLVKPVSASALVDAIIGAVAPDTAPRHGRHAGEQRDYGLQGMSVLLAEDNEINQQIAIELLESVGVTVECANDGRDAVNKVKCDTAYDAVLMDLQMPELDGLSATREIRSDGRFNDLPIIAMTAHAMVEERDRCFAAGMNDHVTKPIEPEVLYHALNRWFRRGAQQAPSPAHTRASAGDAPAADHVPAVPGLDAAAGLRRTAGNRALYRSLLEKFVAGQSATPTAIRVALDAGDRALAERLAHTLKGVSGNIGATVVQAAAADVERAIGKGHDASNSIAALEVALTAVVQSLQKWLPVPAVAQAQSVAPASVESAQRAIKTLAGYLADSDAEAADFLSEHAAELRGALGADRFTGIRKSVEDYDFESALNKLRASTA